MDSGGGEYTSFATDQQNDLLVTKTEQECWAQLSAQRSSKDFAGGLLTVENVVSLVPYHLYKLKA